MKALHDFSILIILGLVETQSAEKVESFMSVFPDSAPSETDDSHTILHGMPKKPSAGYDLFRRQPLSLFFVYACHIRKGTPGKRNLYLACYEIIISLCSE